MESTAVWNLIREWWGHRCCKRSTREKWPVTRCKIIIIIIIIIGLFNSNTGPSYTNKKLQEIYFEAAKHRRDV
jgi:hypothetical protein